MEIRGFAEGGELLGCDVGWAEGVGGCGVRSCVSVVLRSVGGRLWCVMGEGGVEAAAGRRGREVWWEDVELLLAWWSGFNFWLVVQISATVSWVKELRLRVGEGMLLLGLLLTRHRERVVLLIVHMWVIYDVLLSGLTLW